MTDLILTSTGPGALEIGDLGASTGTNTYAKIRI